jgi:hypothetical protein
MVLASGIKTFSRSQTVRTPLRPFAIPRTNLETEPIFVSPLVPVMQTGERAVVCVQFYRGRKEVEKGATGVDGL